jgi:hypothetical protein
MGHTKAVLRGKFIAMSVYIKRSERSYLLARLRRPKIEYSPSYAMLWDMSHMTRKRTYGTYGNS